MNLCGKPEEGTGILCRFEIHHPYPCSWELKQEADPPAAFAREVAGSWNYTVPHFGGLELPPREALDSDVLDIERGPEITSRDNLMSAYNYTRSLFGPVAVTRQQCQTCWRHRPQAEFTIAIDDTRTMNVPACEGCRRRLWDDPFDWREFNG